MSDLTKRVAERAACDGDQHALVKLALERCRSGECCLHAHEKAPPGAFIDIRSIGFPSMIMRGSGYPGSAVRLDLQIEVFGMPETDMHEVLDWIRRRLAILPPPEFIPVKPKKLTTVACRRCGKQIESGNYCSPCRDYHEEQNSPYV